MANAPPVRRYLGYLPGVLDLFRKEVGGCVALASALPRFSSASSSTASAGKQGRGPNCGAHTGLAGGRVGSSDNRLPVMIRVPMLRRCSSSPRQRPQRSAPLSAEVVSCRLPPSCADCFPASPTPRRPGSVLAPSPGRSVGPRHANPKRFSPLVRIMAGFIKAR